MKACQSKRQRHLTADVERFRGTRFTTLDGNSNVEFLPLNRKVAYKCCKLSDKVDEMLLCAVELAVHIGCASSLRKADKLS